MGSEIELVSDGDGVAIFGDPSEVELFLSTAGVASKEIALRPSLGAALNAGSGVAQAGSQIAANSGRWVKLTEESAKALKLGKAMKGSSDGVSRAIATTSKGKVTKILEFVKPGSVGSMLTNPAILAGAAGIMAQLAMQQTMEEITEYLKVIDEKVDDILLAQKNAKIAKMIGVGMVIDDAMFKREHVGRVSEVTWSNLHGAAQTIATTQAYALLQLDALAKKMERSPRSETSPSSPVPPRRPSKTGWRCWRDASSFRTAWTFSKSTGCWTPARTTSTATVPRSERPSDATTSPRAPLGSSHAWTLLRLARTSRCSSIHSRPAASFAPATRSQATCSSSTRSWGSRANGAPSRRSPGARRSVTPATTPWRSRSAVPRRSETSA